MPQFFPSPAMTLFDLAAESVNPYQTASELPSCGYRPLVGLSLYMPFAASHSRELAAVLMAAALPFQLAASALSPSTAARVAPPLSAAYSSALAEMFSPPWPTRAQSWVRVTLSRLLPSILLVMKAIPRL